MCLYCKKLYLKLSRHCQNCHKGEPEIAVILKLPTKSKERRLELIKITREGNFEHNIKELKENGDNLILGRRPTQTKSKLRSSDMYAACPNCLGLILKKSMDSFEEM